MNHRSLLAAALFTVAALAAQAGVTWGTDYASALAQAKQTGRPVLLDFTGSDWCSFCIKLKKEVLAQESFAKLIDGRVILVEVDFPRRAAQDEAVKAQNARLSTEFKVEGFPTLVLLDAAGAEVERFEGFVPGSAKDYLARLEAAIAKASRR